MKFDILYYKFSTFKAITFLALCFFGFSSKAQNSCGNYAGSAMPDKLVCFGEIAYGNSMGVSLNSNSVIQYYLHNNNINSPIDSSQFGFFVNNGNYPLNINLFITAVVGPPNSVGSPILNDDCTDIQDEGTNVVFLDEIIIESNFSCAGANAEITYKVNGGLPAFDSSPFSISGDVVNTVSANISYSFVSFGVLGSYTIEANDNNNCNATQTEQYDCQLPENIDLALTKKLGSGQPQTVTAGSNIVFQIEVTNQGNISLSNVRIADFIPAGLTLADPNWSMVNNYAQTTIPGILPPNSTTVVSITLNSMPTNQTITIQNVAEILQAEMPDGTTITNDDDSQFDNDLNNDGTAINDVIDDINDEDDHDIENIIIEPLAVCLGVAGTMPVDTVFACFDETITITESNSELDANRDVAFYVLHDSPTNVINTITTTNANGSFSNPGNTDCRAFYISYVFGPDSGDGTPNLENECTIVLPGTPVVWLNQITIGSTSTCANDGNNFTINYIVNGGYAACFNSTYTVGGTVSTAQINLSENIEDPQIFSNNSSYTISIKDNIGCTTTNSYGPIICADPNPCSDIVSGIMPRDTIFACASESVTEQEEGSVLGNNIGFYYLHDNSGNALGTIYEKSAVGEFDDFGNYCQMLYISYAIGPDNGNGEPNLLNECGIVLPGTPVIWASPIVFEVDESCNTETGMFTFDYNINGGFAECFDSQYNLSGDINTAIAEPTFNYLNNTPLPGGASYTITANDIYGCSNTSNNGPITCESINLCNNSRGSMGDETIYSCADERITSTETGSVLNADDVSYYVLHQGNSNALVNVINTNSTGTFINPGAQYSCSDLYISYVFGPNNGNGQPALTSPCTQILEGTPVIWAAPIEINTIEDCNEETEQYRFSYTLTGGFPSCIGNNYSVTGDVTNSLAIPNQVFTEPTLFDDGFAYTINVTDEKGCSTNYTSQSIACINPNPCSNSDAGEITLGILYSCADASIDFNIDNLSISDNFVDDGDVDGYVLHDGDPTNIDNIVTKNTDGIFNNPGRSCEILTLSYVIGSDDGTGFPELTDPCTKFSNNIPVIWYPKVNISSTATCDETTGNLIVNFNVSGGASACESSTEFDISGDYQISNITAGGYTIPEQLSGNQPYQIIATDDFDCTSTFTSEIIDCNQPDPFCGNVLGSMQFSNQIRACAGTEASAQQQNTVLASNSIGQYYLHTNDNNTLGTQIANSSSGAFDDPGKTYYCDTLYISYVIGPENGSGEIDLQSECTFVLPGAPVVWSAPIKIFTNEVCDVATGEYKINFELSGGFPECFTSASYDVTGSINKFGLSPGNYVSDNAYQSGTTYDIIVKDDFGCTVNYEEINDVNCDVVTYCFNQAGTAKEARFVCFSGETDGSVLDTSSDLYYEIIYVLHDGVNSLGTTYNYSFDGIFANNGSAPRNTQLYISSIVSILDEDNMPNFDDMCTEIMLPGTPVVFLDQIEVSPSLDCDDETGIVQISFNPTGGYPAYINSGTFYSISINGDFFGDISFNNTGLSEISASNYELTIEDENNCSLTVGGPTNCGNQFCSNQLGSQPQEAFTLCDRESVNAAVENFTITDEAQLIYVLHNRANVIGEILDLNTTGIFINNDAQYPLNTQLYVSAVIGTLGENGLPDFLEPCTITNLPGTPVTFLPAVTVLDDIQCESDNDEITVVFSILGGSGQYTITGDFTGNIMPPNTLGIFTLPSSAQNYALTITDNSNNCETLIVRATECIPTTCNNNSAGSVTQFSQFLCNNESVNVTAQNWQASDDYFLYYFLHDGFNNIGNIVDFNTTGTFINNGQYEANKQFYVSSAVTTSTGGNPNLNSPCFIAALPGTPVIFYDPISVSIVEEACNINTGNYTVRFSISGGVPSFNSSKFYTVSGILISNNITAGQVVTTAPQSVADYIIIVEDDNNCQTTYEKNDVNCTPDCPQFNNQNIRNVISPNGDGINDSWSVPALSDCYPNHKITICNRWGDKVSEIENCVSDCWNGAVSKNGEPLPTGAYYYYIQLNGDNSTEDEIVTGSITLVR